MTLRLTNAEIVSFLIGTIINPILTTNGYTDTPVISSHQNGPEPVADDIYLVVEYAGSKTIKGKPRYISEYQEETPITDSYFNRYNISDNEISIDITEENGEGELLGLIIDSLYQRDIKELFKSNQIALMRIGDIIPAPELLDNRWVKRSVLEIILGIASATLEEIESIETVQFSGTVE